MTTRSQIRIRTIPKFPAQVIAGDGITISVSGGVYTISVNESDSIAAAASADAAAASAAAAVTTANAAAASAAAAAASAATAASAITTAVAGITGDFGIRNRVINPSGQVQQTGSGGTVADGSYTSMDQWIALTQTGTVTEAQTENQEAGTPYMVRLTQSQVTAQRMGLIQWIERANCYDLRGKTVVLSMRVRLSTASHLRLAIVEWTGTADTITKDIVNTWTSTTYTTGNFFTSTSTTVTAVSGSLTSADSGAFATISVSGTVSTSANNIAVFVWSEGTVAQNGTLDVGRVQLEVGSAATSLAWRHISLETVLCYRYYHRKNSLNTQDYLANLQCYSTTAAVGKLYDLPNMLKAPTISISNAGHLGALTAAGGAFNAFTDAGLTTGGNGPYNVRAQPTGSSGLVAGNCTAVGFNSGSAYIDANARL